MALRGLRRRFGGARGEPLAAFTIRVVAASLYPEEPEDEEEYRPLLLVESAPQPDEAAPSTTQFAIGVLLFVEWAHGRLRDDTLPERLHALIPRLRVALELGRLGPAAYARHRAGQQERYFNHREAAAFTVALHRADNGLYVLVGRRVNKGRWTAATVTREAATVAPYEALLQLDTAESLALLAWLELAAARWLAGEAAPFPIATWDPAGRLAPPAD